MADDLDLTKYGGNFSTLFTSGGIPAGDISIFNDPSGSSERGKGFEINGSQFASRQDDAPRDIIYGRAKVGGTVTFFTTNQGTSGQFLHIFVTIAGHEIDAIEKLYLDDREVIFGGGTINTDPRWGLTGTIWDDKVFMSVSTGEDSQEANADLVAQSAALFAGAWTVGDRQRGCAGAYLILVYNEATYPNSIPTIQFLVRGKKLYDPREESHIPNHPETYTWSDNAALAMNDYYASERYGCGAGYSGVPEDILIAAADTSDELVGLNGGGTEKRFTVNGTFDQSKSRQSVLASLKACIGNGPTPIIGNQLHILPAAWRPPTITLTEDDLRSGLRIRSKRSRRDNFNGVKGTFVDAANNYRISDFPAQKSSLYLEQDSNRESYLDVVYDLITSLATAQRNAKIELERARQPLTVEASWAMRCLALTPGDTVSLQISRLGWTPKVFEVITMKLSVDEKEAQCIDLTLQETAEEVTDWNDGQETLIDYAPDTYLPDPGVVQAITGLEVDSGTDQLIKNGDGTIITRALVEWDTAADPFANEIEIEYKQSADSVWQRNPNVSSINTQAFVVNLQDGVSYDFRVRVKTGAGFYSDYTTELGHVVVGKTAPPSDVVNFHADLRPFEIALGWDKVTDVDLRGYEIRYGDALSDWDSATFLAEIRGTSYSVAFQLAGTYKFFIRAVDTSGNYSFLPGGDTVVVPAPAAPVVFDSISGPNLLLDWEDVASFFALDYYEISYGATYGGAQFLLRTKSTQFSTHVDWGGDRRFYVVAVDVAGNPSTPAIVDVTIESPGPVQNLIPKAIDNFALLGWTPPATGTLPIDHYDVFRGDDFSGAVFLGEVAGTFFTYFEAVSGTFIYWIRPVDSAMNEGTELSVTATINQPTDYVLIDDQGISAWDTYDHSKDLGAGETLGPIELGVDYDDHFTGNGYGSPQDQIDDGYPALMQPGATTGYVEKTIDYGTVLTNAVVHVTWELLVLYGTLAIDPRISYSEDGSSWTDVDSADVLAADFQYIKVKLTFDGADDHALGVLRNVRVKLDVKVETDQGSGTADASDVGGTQVLFNLPFIDVYSIGVFLQSTAPGDITYDFVDVPDPTEFFVYAWDSAGARDTKNFTWLARGVRRT